MPRSAPAPAQTPEQEGFVSPKKEDTEHIDEASNLRAAIEILDEDFKSQNLFVKIARISGFLGAVPKRGYNAYHKYHYTLEADLVGVVRMYLAAAGIVIIPSVTAWEKEGQLTTVDVEYKVTDGNESFSFTIPGTGSDTGDKGMYKALTGSNKYAIMKLFKIETGDDPESDTRVDERAAQQDQAPRERPTVRSGQRGTVRRGGHTTTTSPIQLRRISELTKTLAMTREDILSFVSGKFGVEFPEPLPEGEKEQSAVIVSVLNSLTTEQAGDLIADLVARVDALAVEEAGGGGYA